MSYAPVGDNIILQSGKLWLDIKTTAGARQGYRFVGNVSKFEDHRQTKDFEKRDMTTVGRERLTYVAYERTTDLNWEMDEMGGNNYALFTSATPDVFYTQSSATVTAQHLNANGGGTTIVLDRAYPLLHQNVAAVVVKVGATVKTLGTDYEVDVDSGLVYIYSTGSIAAGDDVTADYTAPAITSSTGKAQINFGTLPTVRAAVRLIGIPLNSTQTWMKEFWDVAVLPNGSVSDIADNTSITIPVTCKVIADLVGHPTNPTGYAKRLK